ncbi:hypothetical protein SCLCIDRAFT_23310 [Scleroderma citrinum Foug A]|uniref:DUF6532 domain-containing protein n=1 Tax=Scleroderma citrinum Foug A TaxID=1036808 RepID=A0A0C3E9D9_9AGAM|nr:hypothetical protein SCLCIDRAFT_23310 [Scleroderma citrinum Foug A]
MDIATANEPLNPMAPSMQKSTSCGSRTSGTVPVSRPLSNTGQGPPLTYQTATAGTHSGFRPSANNKSLPSHDISSGKNQSAPSSHASGLAGLQSTSASHNFSRAPTDALFCPSPLSEGSHVPKRFSQVPRPLSQTYSIHNLQGYTTHPSQFTHNFWSSQHQSPQSLNNVDSQSDNFNGSRFPQENHENKCYAHNIEPDINEISPDEDDRIARRVLQGINNRIKLTHTDMFTEPTPEHEAEDYSLNLDAQCDPSDTPQTSSTAHVTVAAGPLAGSAQKFRSYPNKFHEVIEWAKLISQCECATKCAFPDCAMFLDITSVECFNEAISECEDVPPSYWPQYRKELCVLLWEALMMWRLILKSKARDIVLRFYKLGNQFSVEENLAIAQDLIKGSSFVRDGVDKEGSTNNFAAPALAALVVEFFYTGPSALGPVFPKVFGHEALKVAICLAATALRAAIDEYNVTGARQDCNFEYAGYSKVFNGFVNMQWIINSNAKHAAKTKALTMTAKAPVVAYSDEFIPILD